MREVLELRPGAAPEAVEAFLAQIAALVRAGNGASVVPVHAELTTAEAAELLHISRPHLVKQLEAGAIPFHRVGTHRRLRLADVIAYREQEARFRRFVAVLELGERFPKEKRRAPLPDLTAVWRRDAAG